MLRVQVDLLPQAAVGVKRVVWGDAEPEIEGSKLLLDVPSEDAVVLELD